MSDSNNKTTKTVGNIFKNNKGEIIEIFFKNYDKHIFLEDGSTLDSKIEEIDSKLDYIISKLDELDQKYANKA